MGEIINSLWIGKALSPLEQLSIESFVQNGHEYHLYCYGKVGGIPKGAVVRDAETILPRSEIFCYEQGPGKGSVAAFSNLFRYKLLLENGGWWMDADMICLRAMDFDAPLVFASEWTDGTIHPTCSAMKIPRGHDIAHKLYEAAREEKNARLAWGTTGPKLLTRIIEENKFGKYVQPPDVFCPLRFDEVEKLLQAKSVEELISSESRAIHLWHEAWRRGRWKLDASGSLTKANPNFLRKIFPKLRPCAPLGELLEKYGLKKQRRFSIPFMRRLCKPAANDSSGGHRSSESKSGFHRANRGACGD